MRNRFFTLFLPLEGHFSIKKFFWRKDPNLNPLYRVEQKVAFLTNWDPKFYFSKNDPSRGELMRIPEPVNFLTLIQRKIGFLKRKWSFSSFFWESLSRGNFMRENDFEMRDITFMY